MTTSPTTTVPTSALNTPMLKQYMDIKANHQDAILFFRLGDFYEMFLDDAITAARELDLTLTGRGKDENRVPMCGIPHHAVDNYLPKLVSKGYKVALCEQTESPDLSKGITQREVVKVITPGTLISPHDLTDTDTSYLGAICHIPHTTNIGLSFVDVSTGLFRLCIIPITTLSTYLSTLDINELIIDERITSSHLPDISISSTQQEVLSPSRATHELCRHFNIASLSGFGIQSLQSAFPAAWAILDYVTRTQQNRAPQITKCLPFNLNTTLNIDKLSVRHLELIQNTHLNDKKGSLFWVLNHTKTAIGARQLQWHIKHPSRDITTINHRLDAVEILKEDLLSREEIREILKQIYDIERLISRIATGLNNPRDIIALQQSLSASIALASILPHINTGHIFQQISQFITDMSQETHPFHQIIHTIHTAIIKDPPPTTRNGHIIQHTYHTELNQLVQSFSDIKQWISKLESVERKNTGIKSLKVGFNKVFGYYFQIPNTYKDQVPNHYIRKQTLTNAERYITPELKEKETILLNGEEKQIALEQSIYQEIVQMISTHIPHLQTLADYIGQLDYLQSLATHAQKYRYCRPTFLPDTDRTIQLKQSRHPVIEKTTPESLVANDITLTKDTPFTLITGPNMAGKSTLMRQVALTVIMAQMGSFVPAESATLSPIDQLFTRIGALDDLYRGQSTFMVEMLETAAILNNATSQSLILLDEIGRGTSTYDGLSIASAISEYIYTTISARTFFATHYHELTQLSQKYTGITNISMAITETDGQLVFNYKVQNGPADKSYGIHVANMAGLPTQVIQRAEDFLSHFESQQDNAQVSSGQLSLF